MILFPGHLLFPPLTKVDFPLCYFVSFVVYAG